NLSAGTHFVPLMNETATSYTLVGSHVLGLAYGSRYLEIDLVTKRSVFDLKVPDSEIRSLVLDPVKQTMLAGSRGGTIAVIDRMNGRPVLASEITLPDRATASKILYSSQTDTFYALGGSTGVVFPLVR